MAKFEKKNYHMVKFLNEKIPTSRQFYEFFYVEKMQRIRQIERRRAELCSFQTLKGKNYRLVNNGQKLLDFNPCCLVLFTKISQGRL